MALPRIPAVLLLALASLSAEPAAPANPLLDYVRSNTGRQAYGVYFQKQKLGWMIIDTRLATHEGRPAAEVVTEFRAEMIAGGKTITIEAQQSTRYALEGDGDLIASRQRKVEDGKESLRTAARDGDGLRIESRIGDLPPTTRKVPRSKDTLATSRALDLWLQGVPKKGATFEKYSIDLESQDVDKKETYTFLEKKQVPLNGVPTDVFHVRILSQGMTGDAEVTSDGRIVRGKIGPLDLRPEEESVAKQLKAAVADLLTQVPVTVDLGAPGALDELEIEVLGTGDFAFPGSPRQRAERKDASSVRLALRRDARAKEAAPLDPKERDRFLQATPTIQSDDLGVRDIAARVVGDSKDPLESSRRLCRWVHKSLKKRYGANASTAAQVLEQREGDCTEHALLFTALARAAGVPARQVGGLMFARMPGNAFAWHAWAEIHDGRQWVTVDPTWDQVFVDAGHLCFTSDIEDFAWVGVLGSIRIKVLRWKARP